jgi:hypothetical protein
VKGVDAALVIAWLFKLAVPATVSRGLNGSLFLTGQAASKFETRTFVGNASLRDSLRCRVAIQLNPTNGLMASMRNILFDLFLWGEKKRESSMWTSAVACPRRVY